MSEHTAACAWIMCRKAWKLRTVGTGSFRIQAENVNVTLPCSIIGVDYIKHRPSESCHFGFSTFSKQIKALKIRTAVHLRTVFTDCQHRMKSRIYEALKPNDRFMWSCPLVRCSWYQRYSATMVLLVDIKHVLRARIFFGYSTYFFKCNYTCI